MIVGRKAGSAPKAAYIPLVRERSVKKAITYVQTKYDHSLEIVFVVRQRSERLLEI